jgi:hypothetical protein
MAANPQNPINPDLARDVAWAGLNGQPARLVAAWPSHLTPIITYAQAERICGLRGGVSESVQALAANVARAICPRSFAHRTVQTGHTTGQSLVTDIPAWVLDMLDPLVRNSGGHLPTPDLAAWSVTINGTVADPLGFTLHDPHARPIVCCTWSLAPALTLSMPALTLDIDLQPAIATLSPADIGWLGDWERCFAAAILRARARHHAAVLAIPRPPEPADIRDAIPTRKPRGRRANRNPKK